MTTKEEIKNFKKYMETRHGERIEQQKTDQTFFEDTYALPLIKDDNYKIRTGYVAGMVNGITQQLITDIPKVYTEPKKSRDKITASFQEGADRIASESNRWMRILSQFPQNPFQETFKKKNVRGESWIYIVHNEALAKWGIGKGKDKEWQQKNPWQDVYLNKIPVHFILYDPMVVLADPSEEVDGKVPRIIIPFRRTAGDIRAHYPKWSSTKDDDADVEFFLYIDDKVFYAEVDDVPLFDTEFRKNLYGFVPCVHALSGWGIETQDRNPALLALSRIRMMRDRVREDSMLSSDFCFNMHRFAHRHKTLFVPAGVEIPDGLFAEYRDAPDALSIMQLPEGATPDSWRTEESLLFEAPAFAYRDRVRADLNMEYPLPLRGTATGTSGRQEDILAGHGMAIYNCAINNTNKEWAQALDMAFKIIGKIPNLLPPTLKEGDIESYSDIKVDVKKQDPMELSRRTAEGTALWKDGAIDFEEFHIKYLGKTKEEAVKSKAKVWVERAMRENPAFQQLIVQTAAEEMGKEEELAVLEAQLGGAGGISPVPKIESKGGEPRLRNIKTPLGSEMASESIMHEPRERPRV